MHLLWRSCWIGILVLTAAIYAIPNLYGKSPALKVKLEEGVISELRAQSLRYQLEQAGIDGVHSQRDEQQNLLLLFENGDDQSRAFSLLRNSHVSDLKVGYILATQAPEWLRSIKAEPLSLGLDLLGGVHFLLEISGSDLVDNLYQSFTATVEEISSENNIAVDKVRHGKQGVQVYLTQPETAKDLSRFIAKQEGDVVCRRQVEPGVGDSLFCQLTPEAIDELNSNAVKQNISALRNRVDELGVAEPIIQRSGDRRVIVQLPGVQDPARAREILGSTASVEFRMVHGSYSKPSARTFKRREGGGIDLENRIIVSGEHIVNASAGLDPETGGPVVNIRLNDSGAGRMSRTTSTNVNRPMAVVYKETNYELSVDGLSRIPRNTQEVINVATIREPFGLRFQISGLELQESRDLALLLRAGALKAPMVIIEERSVGPSLGKLNVDQGLRSVILALLAVMVFMLLYYRWMGLIANIALTVNAVAIVSILSFLQATLTLPGIAGIVLTIGMSVDANTLVFERIREESRISGTTLNEAVERGYRRALGTITDSNLTTFFAALVLFVVSSGSVRGFAVTLAVGIATSMFTAVVLSRLLTDISCRKLGIKKLLA